jgi:hypothetical protein
MSEIIGHSTGSAQTRSPAIQAKLTVSHPGDVHEQEADRVANAVMRMPESSTQETPLALSSARAPNHAQRMCTDCDEEHKKKPDAPVRRKEQTADAPPVTQSVAANIQSLRGGGSALPAATRAFFEPRFGADFSGVRVHNDQRAADTAKSLNAKAFTVGQDIAFGQGQFVPDSHEGQNLLAHELTHVVQQRVGHAPRAAFIQRDDKQKSPRVTLDPGLAQVEEVWTQLRDFELRAVPQLKAVGGRIDSFLTDYDQAYSAVTRLLEQAKEDAKQDEKWGIALGIIIGVGVGLAGGELFTAASLLGKVVAEFVGESIEGGAAQVLAPPATNVDYTLSSEVNNDKIARAHERELRKAWEAVALVGAAGYEFSKRRDELRDGAKTGAARLTPADKSKLQRLRSGIASADKALRIFVATFDTAVLQRSERQLERDLWIRWMSQSRHNSSAALSSTLSKRLTELGVWLDLGDTMQVGNFEAAQKRVAGLEQIGLIGVVVVPPSEASNMTVTHFGMVHIRADAYAAVGRQQPTKAKGEQYVKILWQPDQYLRTGEVVMIEDHQPMFHGYKEGGLIVKRMNAELSVDAKERTAAFAEKGVPPQSWYPDPKSRVLGKDWYLTPGGSPLRAAGLGQVVIRAVEQLDRSLVVSMSEEGVLVSDASGKALVLFTAYVSFGDAKRALTRMACQRVVAVDLNPNSQIADFGDAQVLVTRKLEEQVATAQILLVRPPTPGSKHFIGPVAPISRQQ